MIDNNNDDNKPDILWKEYIKKHNEYVKKYGQKTLILMLIGSFYEMYSIFDQGPNLYEISQLLDIACTRKCKAKPESFDNPKLVGFQMNSLEKFLGILTNNNYTVIVYDQKMEINLDAKKKKDKKKVHRFVSGIYTNSININNIQKHNNNYLMCVYIINEEQKNYKPLKSVGLSCIDLSTGQVYVHSSHSQKYDEFIALDDTSRFINNMCPGEILIYYDEQTKNKEKSTEIHNYLCGYLNLEFDKCRFYDKIDANYKILSFQETFLKKIYPNSENLMTTIEQLDLETEPHIIISLCLMFDFINDKMPSFLKDIKTPEFNFNNTHLILGNNAITQLDLFENKENSNIQTKYKCLFNIVNETLTPLGERYLRNVIASPFINKHKLNEIYDNTEKMKNLNIPEKINNFLCSIRDIERLARKMELKIIKPQEMCIFISSYEAIIEIIKIINCENNIKNILQYDCLDDKIQKMLEHISKIFNLENLNLCCDINFDERINIYNQNIHKDIDDLNIKIMSGKGIVEKLRDLLEGYFPKSKKEENKENLNIEKIELRNTKKEGNHLLLSISSANIIKKYVETNDIKISDTINITQNELLILTTKTNSKIMAPTVKKFDDLIQLKNKLIEILMNNTIDTTINQEEKSNKIKIGHNAQDGHYLCLTTNNAKILKSVLDNNKDKTIGFNLKNTDFVFKYNVNNAKIIIPSLNNEHVDKLEEYADMIGTLYKLHYLDDVEKIYDEFSNLFLDCNEFITKIDYLNSCTILSMKNGYVRPTINEKTYSYVKAVKLRHPIVEKIIDHEYVPHDITIGENELKGMLIYGLNSAGKSVLMKSIGLCIIMAQSGLFVPADTFEYSQYHSLLTRISGNDNIFKGLSSFALEMSEINSILKRSNQNTLIIGDEICRGTEHISGNALVASTIIKLSKLNPTFIFTTHLHDIMTLDEITSINNVKAYHLKVSYDTANDILIYDRKLSEGCGEQIYGITVAKYMIQDNDFIDCATKIKNKLLNTYDTLISGKKSNYNKDVYVYECNLCHTKDNVKLTNLETHHINFQKNCDTNDIVINKKHLKKNDKANLIVLCNECHDKLHNGEIKITGYIQTSKGKKII